MYYFLHLLLCADLLYINTYIISFIVFLFLGAALSSSLSSVTLPSELTVGTSYPSGVSMERACGDVTGAVSQDNDHRMER